jgi:hypothetical protein
MIKVENVFGVSRTVTYVIFGASIFLVIGMINSIFLHQEKIHYQIISPDGNYHLTTEINEENGCITFIDEIGIENKICGSYRVKKI